MRVASGFPISSDAAQPKILVAAGFMKRIRLFPSIEMIASGAVLAIVRYWASISRRESSTRRFVYIKKLISRVAPRKAASRKYEDGSMEKWNSGGRKK